MTIHILIRKAILANAETRHGRIEAKPGEAVAIIKFPEQKKTKTHIGGLFLEEITESQFETYELFGITILHWEEITARRDDFNSWILLDRIERVLKRNGELT
jgi:hypothetical protein